MNDDLQVIHEKKLSKLFHLKLFTKNFFHIIVCTCVFGFLQISLVRKSYFYGRLGISDNVGKLMLIGKLVPIFARRFILFAI